MLNFLEELIDKHISEEGALDKEGLLKTFKSEHTKVVVDKSVFNEKLSEIKQLEQQIEEAGNYKSKYEAVIEERKAEGKKRAILDALTDSVDPDFVLSLIESEIEYDEEEGTLTNIEEVLAKRKENQPYLFTNKEPDKVDEADEVPPAPTPAPKAKDGKLANPKGKPLTVESIMSLKDEEEKERLIAANMDLFI